MDEFAAKRAARERMRVSECARRAWCWMPEYLIEYAVGRSFNAHWMPTLAAGFSLLTFVADFKKTHNMEDVSVVVADPITLQPLTGHTWLLPGSAVRVFIETGHT